ncbi:arginine-glutamic acid dipeptide repeats protein isoform X5 [Hypomesus transpacificus]|uniref:arginine-glutamic acid dipeptide repeats protein isoform X5 n=1 Tax=Hypomesus transpacificus TaxID=137520 RepID=UPI001F078A31|nr:arginine-glutamic acid dipeptide repeats protein isoform X5 [Hypomesus transpacificus]
MNQKRICALCQCAGENRGTGPLSSKNSVTAHENCLLYSSGLYCQNSPVDDSLCGFSVDDVEKEIRRGNRLSCHECNVKGATVGCEVKKCKRTYHYPCARKDGAEIIEDRVNGTYKVYCKKHGSTKISTEVSNRVKVPFRRALSFNGSDYAEAGPSGGCDSDPSRNHKCTSPKRTSSLKQDNGMPRQHSPLHFKRKRRLVIEDSDSGEDDGTVDMECAPLESDLENSGLWQDATVAVPPQAPHSHHADSAAASTSGHALPQNRDEDTSIDCDNESESLLLSVTILPLSQFPATGAGASPASIPASPPTSGPTLPSDPTLPSGPQGSPSTHTVASPSSPEGCHVPTSPSSVLFWRNCNQAGCTADIFNTFISDMSDISHRILTDQATQEDYDLSLRVLEASGKLNFLVTEHWKALERKRKELERSLAALKTASSVLKR